MSGTIFNPGEPCAELGPHALGLWSCWSLDRLFIPQARIDPGSQDPRSHPPDGSCKVSSKVRGLPGLSTSKDPSVVFLQITSKEG